MTSDDFDQGSWERRWARAMGHNPQMVANRPPNAIWLAEVGDLPPGSALDAGCGHGAEAIRLAAAGWQVTAVDFSTTALDPQSWDVIVAEERPRAVAGSGVDAVVRAVRRG